jgi:hypothetical protein
MDLQLLQRSDVKLCPSQSLMLRKETALPFVIPAGAPKGRSGGICGCCPRRSPKPVTTPAPVIPTTVARSLSLTFYT